MTDLQIPGMEPGLTTGPPCGGAPSPAARQARSYANRPVKAAKALAWARSRAQEARQAGNQPDATYWEDFADELEAVLTRRASCRVCGRKLEDPNSVRLGIGPDCRRAAS